MKQSQFLNLPSRPYEDATITKIQLLLLSEQLQSYDQLVNRIADGLAEMEEYQDAPNLVGDQLVKHVTQDDLLGKQWEKIVKITELMDGWLKIVSKREADDNRI